MDGWVDGRMDGWTHHGCMSGLTVEKTYRGRWTEDRWMEGR